MTKCFINGLRMIMFLKKTIIPQTDESSVNKIPIQATVFSALSGSNFINTFLYLHAFKLILFNQMLHQFVSN